MYKNCRISKKNRCELSDRRTRSSKYSYINNPNTRRTNFEQLQTNFWLTSSKPIEFDGFKSSNISCKQLSQNLRLPTTITDRSSIIPVLEHNHTKKSDYKRIARLTDVSLRSIQCFALNRFFLFNDSRSARISLYIFFIGKQSRNPVKSAFSKQFRILTSNFRR